MEALEVFDHRAQELTFLQSRATFASEPSEKFVANNGVVFEAA